MPKTLPAPARHFSRALGASLAVAVLAADQTTKAMVQRSIPEYAVIPIVPHFLSLTHTENAGAAFSLFASWPAPWRTALLVIVSGILLAVVAWLVLRSGRVPWVSGIGLALIVGGAASNLLDRIRAGKVVDFVDIYFRGYHWPSFNLADSAIVVGAGFLILHYLRSPEKEPSG